MSQTLDGRRRLRFLVLLLAVGYAVMVLASLHPYWFDLTLVDDDARSHLMPYLLPPADTLGDRLLVDYARDFVPPGYRWIFQLTAPVLHPLVFSRLLGLALVTAAWALAGRVGLQLGGRLGGAAALLLAAHSGFLLENGYGGMYRGFALPLLLGWLSLMLAGRRRAAWILLPVMALFYPQAFMVAGLAAGADLLWRLAPRPPRTWTKADRGVLGTAFACGLLAALAMLPNLRRPAYFGPFVTAAQAACMPEWWQPHGRLKFFPQASPAAEIGAALADGLMGAPATASAPAGSAAPRSGPALAWTIGLLGLAALALRLRRGERRLRPLLLLAASALLLYSLARLTLFRLGWPDRFINYPLALWSLAAWPLAWGALRPGLRRGALPRAAALATVALPFILGHPLPGAARQLSSDSAPFQPLYRFIAARLPADVLVAGWPDNAMDDLPIYARRAVLADDEMAQPMYVGYYGEMRQRLQDSVRAYYAFEADDPVFRRLRERWGVTHFLVEKRVYHPVRPPLIIEPFRALARSLYDASDRERHLLFAPPPASRVYEDALVILVDLSRLD